MAQTLARHSDIRLTLGVYAHVGSSLVLVEVAERPDVATPRSSENDVCWHFDFRHEFRDSLTASCRPETGCGDSCRQTNDFRKAHGRPRLSPRPIIISVSRDYIGEGIALRFRFFVGGCE